MLWTGESGKVKLRELGPDEAELLRDFVYEAIFIPEGMEPPGREIIERPELRVYYEDFGAGKADCCIVAEDGGKAVGAVWARIMEDYGHVDPETPSIAISLYREYRGQGTGTRLLNGILSCSGKKGMSGFPLRCRRQIMPSGCMKKPGLPSRGKTRRNTSWCGICGEKFRSKTGDRLSYRITGGWINQPPVLYRERFSA